jgi:hypothetical protein
METFCFSAGNMLNVSAYLAEFGWIGGNFPPNNCCAAWINDWVVFLDFWFEFGITWRITI